jgi:hypothetical protein
MSYMCPVCNGLQQLNPMCSRCGGAMHDEGRISDAFGPYSPYRQIDDLKLTNGFLDLSTRQCVHSLYCPHCGSGRTQYVQEWYG